MAAPLHISHNLTLVASKDVAGTQAPLNCGGAVAFDSYREGGSYFYTVAASAVDAVLPMLGVANAQLVFVEVPEGETVSLKLNNVGNTAIVLRANASNLGVGRFLLETSSVTALYVSNAAAYTIRIWVGIFGD